MKDNSSAPSHFSFASLPLTPFCPLPLLSLLCDAPAAALCTYDPTNRRDFLSAGTMAKGAAESGVAESYMCSKVARNPLVQRCCAAYLGEFEAQQGANNIQKGTQWLVSISGFSSGGDDD